MYPNATVPASAIRDADPLAAPSEVRLHTGETLFIAGARHHELRAFCERNDIPIRSRPDLWDALLQPFVDTEFTPELAAQASALLDEFGVSPEEAAAIRDRFAAPMVAYNFGTGLWDWVHLGLFDLLQAVSGPSAGEHRLSTEDFAETYRWAMVLADRSAPATGSRQWHA